MADEGEVTALADFRFATLHKFMSPLYAKLNFAGGISEEEKKEFTARILAEFFKRLREYNGISLKELASSSGVNLERLSAFERNAKDGGKELPSVYVRAFQAEWETDFFFQQLLEFHHPQVKEAKEKLAPIVLKKFGIRFPGFDYERLGAKLGTILHLNF